MSILCHLPLVQAAEACTHIRKRSVVVWLFVCGWVLWAPKPAGAVPAFPDGGEAVQPDGNSFRLHLRGDEYFSWTETEEGYAVLEDPADGFWKYARPDDAQACFRIIPEAQVGSADPARHGLGKRALPEARGVREKQRAGFRASRADPVALPVPEKVSGLQLSGSADPAASPPSPIPVSGTKAIRNIVLLACFSNHWNSAGGTVNASYGRVAVSEYSNLFNQVNHTTDGAVGSVRDYYSEVSYGKLTVQSVISTWVQLPQSEDYYGADGASHDTNWLQMISDAITAADAAGLNFSQGDSDGDGWVDCLTVIHSGHGQEITGNPATCIWSKQGEIGSFVTKDGVKMKRCHTEPALRGATNSTSIIRIGVICHEMGHFFGLSDLYDYSGKTYGVGDWGVMGYGSWNGSQGNRPAHFCAHSKYMLGFVKPATAHSQTGATLARVEDNAAVLLLRDGMSNGEYFLLENRANAGFDNDTASIFPGLLIYHVDSKSSNNDSNTWAHPLVKMEEADGDDSLGGKAAYSEAGDAWTSTSGLAGGFRDQTGNQSANAMRYQAPFYKRSDSSSYYSYLRVTNFSAAANVMSCNIQSLKTTVGSQTTNASGYTVSWAACSQASQYEVQEGARATLASFSDGAEDEDAMYENWYLSGTVRRSADGLHTGAYSYLMQFYSFSSSIWFTPVQSMILQKPFTVTAGTSVSFYLLSHLWTECGYLKCEISKNSGDTWSTLGTYNGYINSWALHSFNYAALNALGITAGDNCILRFIMNAEYASGWSGYPEVGFALDDISITGVAVAGYGGWATLTNNVTATSYAITSRTNGVHAYRVRAYANATWQGYGSVGETSVTLPPGGFEDWAQTYCPGVPVATAFIQDRNLDGIQNGFDYTFGPNLATNAPLITVFVVTNTPVLDIPKQIPSTAPYVDVRIEMTRALHPPSWSTNGTHAIDATGEPTNRYWYLPDVIGTNGFFRLRGLLK